MITFTDPRLYVQGIGTALMMDPASGDILYFSDKFQDANITSSADDGIINAGIGNAPVIMIPSNANVSVALTAADYSNYVKGASVGATMTNGAPVMVCKEMSNDSGTLLLPLSGAAKFVAGPGMSNPVCYVQEKGAASTIAQDGVAYSINAATGAIVGFTPDPGTTYIVTYYVAQANAKMTTITTNMKGKVVYFVLERPIYVNIDPATNVGDLYGKLYEIIPRLQLMPDGGSNNGSQSAPTTTGITGRAIAYDANVIAGGDCDKCSMGGSPLMYRVIVPCSTNTSIDGIIGILGGYVGVEVSDTFQLTPYVVVDGQVITNIAPASFSYVSSATGVATVGASTGVISGVSAGSAEVTVTYTVGGTTYTDYVNVEVE